MIRLNTPSPPQNEAASPGLPGGPATTSGRGRMAVQRLVVTRFRNYARACLALDHRHVVLTGENGAGKTNLLEAVSFLAPGRGLRGARLSEVSRRPSPSPDTPSPDTPVPGVALPPPAAADAVPAPWGVAATVMAPGGTVDIGTGLAATPDGDKRVVRIDGVQKSGSGVLGEYVRILWLTPQMDRLFAEGAGGRRRFLDRMVLGFDPGHPARVSAYEKAMRERTRLLAEDRRDRAWLAGLEGQMAEHGLAIAAARAHAVSQLAAAISAAPESAFPQAAIALDAGFETAPGEDILAMASVDAEDAFRARLEAARGRDGAAGRALEGPHRADLAVRHLGKDMDAAACSTGEQKALLIGLVLANARALAAGQGAPPLLLLDEVAAHLDARRRVALFDELDRLGAQAWMTGTDRSLFEALGERAQHIDVADAELTPRP